MKARSLMMIDIVGKLILFIITLLLPISNVGSTVPFSYAVWLKMPFYILLLTALACSLLLSLLLSRSRTALVAVYLLILAGVIFRHSFAHFLPFLLYDCFVLGFRSPKPKFRAICCGLQIAAGVILLTRADYTQLILLLPVYLTARFATGFNQLESSSITQLDEQREQIINLRKASLLAHAGIEREQHLATLQERNRISRELHDVIGHTLSASILQLEALIVTEPDGSRRDSLRSLQNRLSEGMSEIRSTLHSLHQESFNLKARIEQLIADQPDRKFHLRYNLPDDLAFELRFDLLNLVKEGITNFLKHSDGDRMSISLLAQPAFYTIRMEDNGNPKKHPGRQNPTGWAHGARTDEPGMGLLAMREIADKYGGSYNQLSIKGFGLLITIPRNRQAEPTGR